MSKPKLIILEGFDRVGKDTLLKTLSSKDDGYAYMQHTPNDMPNYRSNPTGFYKFLEKWLDNQVGDLTRLSKQYKTIYLSRFFASDYVYSILFNRQNIANKFLDKLNDVFDIENVIFLWDTYEDYIHRCKSSQSNIEYDKDEFVIIQSLYSTFANYNKKNTIVMYISDKLSKEEIYKMFIDRPKPMNSNLSNNEKTKSMFDLFFELKSNKDLTKLKVDVLSNNIWKDKGFIFTGVGKNWYICEKVVKTFLSMGIKSQALDPVHALHGDMGMVDGQYVFCISKSGTTEELVKFAKTLRSLITIQHKSAILIGFCLNSDFDDNQKIYDYLIKPTKKWTKDKIYEFDKRNLVPTLSINIMQMVLDEFGVELFESDQILVDNYKYNHLAGENGRRLGVDNLLSEFVK